MFSFKIKPRNNINIQILGKTNHVLPNSVKLTMKTRKRKKASVDICCNDGHDLETV